MGEILRHANGARSSSADPVGRGPVTDIPDDDFIPLGCVHTHEHREALMTAVEAAWHSGLTLWGYPNEGTKLRQPIPYLGSK